jgi:5-methylcytosine-specific restriction enzyme B
MPFFTADHLVGALKYLPEHTHPSLVSFLAMLKAQVPASSQPTKSFGSTQETDLMRAYFAPAGEKGARPWYVPFGPQKEGGTNWKPRTYGGASLQRMRTGS